MGRSVLCGYFGGDSIADTGVAAADEDDGLVRSRTERASDGLETFSQHGEDVALVD